MMRDIVCVSFPLLWILNPILPFAWFYLSLADCSFCESNILSALQCLRSVLEKGPGCSKTGKITAGKLFPCGSSHVLIVSTRALCH